MIPIPEWHRLHMVACHGASSTECAQALSGIDFWEDMAKIGRKNTTLSDVSRHLVRDGILLSLFMDRDDLLTPLLKTVVSQSEATIGRLKNDYRNWEILAESEKRVGTEFLVQFPSYIGIPSHFGSAFWRREWENPVVFSFLIKKRRQQGFTTTPHVPIKIFQSKDDEYDVRFRNHAHNEKKKKSDKRYKERRKAHKTRTSDRTLGRRFFLKEDVLISPLYEDAGDNIYPDTYVERDDYDSSSTYSDVSYEYDYSDSDVSYDYSEYDYDISYNHDDEYY